MASKKITTGRKAAPAAEKKRTASKREETSIPSIDDIPYVCMSAKPSSSALAGRLQKANESLKEKLHKKGVHVLSPAELRKRLYPLNDILLQHLYSSVGIRSQCVTRILGPEKIGKTAFMFYLAGMMAEQGHGVVWIDGDNKQTDPARVAAYLGKDKKWTNEIMHRFLIAQAFSLAEIDSAYELLVPVMRKAMDELPEHRGKEIFVFIDDWSAAMSKAEAAGRSDVAEDSSGKKKKEKKKAIGDTANFGHAKHAQAMRRAMATFMKTYNASFVISGAQNDKVDMKAIPGMPAPSELDNTTSIGGRAFRSVASYQLVMKREQKIYNKAKVHIGHTVKVRMLAGTYGPAQDSSFQIFSKDIVRDDDSYGAAISFAMPTAEFFVKNKLLGVKIDSGLVTCDSLGLCAVSPQEFYAAFCARPDLVEMVGSTLGIEGYKGDSLTPRVTPETEDDDEDEDGEDYE